MKAIAEFFATGVIAAVFGLMAGLLAYAITNNGDTAGTVGVIVWIALWLGIAFIDPGDLFN